MAVAGKKPFNYLLPEQEWDEVVPRFRSYAKAVDGKIETGIIKALRDYNERYEAEFKQKMGL